MEEAVERDEDIWYDDGNVVISSGIIPVRMFKCHRSFLAKHCEAFNGMFSLPLSADNEMYDGVPCVHLPDNGDDVRSFLLMLHNPAYVQKHGCVRWN